MEHTMIKFFLIRHIQQNHTVYDESYYGSYEILIDHIAGFSEVYEMEEKEFKNFERTIYDYNRETDQNIEILIVEDKESLTPDYIQNFVKQQQKEKERKAEKRRKTVEKREATRKKNALKKKKEQFEKLKKELGE